MLLATFVTIERRTPQPLVRLGILRSGHIVRANLGAMAIAGCYFGFQFVATLFLQSELGWSAIETALAFLPAGLLVAFGSPRIGALVDRFGTGRLIATGFVVIVLREIDGLSYDDIADSLEVAVGTVKSRLTRARQTLREQLREVRV